MQDIITILQCHDSSIELILGLGTVVGKQILFSMPEEDHKTVIETLQNKICSPTTVPSPRINSIEPFYSMMISSLLPGNLMASSVDKHHIIISVVDPYTCSPRILCMLVTWQQFILC